jgi:hypothetical protein
VFPGRSLTKTTNLFLNVYSSLESSNPELVEDGNRNTVNSLCRIRIAGGRVFYKSLNQTRQVYDRYKNIMRQPG